MDLKITHRMVALVVVCGLVLASESALSAPINPFNVRPQPVGTAPGSEPQLQDILDDIYGPGAVDAYSDQQTAGIWQLPGGGYGATAPIIQVEAAGYANSNVFGIWTGWDTNGPITTVPIFLGSAGPGTTATLKWAAGDPSTLIVEGGSGVNTGIYPGIYRYWFGFYLDGPGTSGGTSGKFWTADQLNPGGWAAAYAYVGTGNRWTVAFEDQNYNAGVGDNDHNDMVLTIESIVPVPEPLTVFLLGGGIVSAALLRRRKR
ncbi:MAG: PEP-CTERM sorting domain-containing protein [Planctomycetota bacterium]